MNEPKLIRVRRISGRLRVVTGLRIGGSQETLEISGLDNPIIRNPANNEPYVPGSSLKGKLRSLAEWAAGEIPADGDVTRPRETSETARVFGTPARKPEANDPPEVQRARTRGPTRLIVRDAPLTEEWRRRFRDGVLLTEVKTENSINRLTSMANPRPMERVLPAVEFELELLYRVFDVDGDNGQADEELFERVLWPALELVQADALGGGGSRGNGKVEFVDMQVDGQPRNVEVPRFAGSGAA